MFTPRKESQTPTGSVHVGTPDTNISEWAKFKKNDEYCQMLMKRIEAETKQEAKRQASLKNTCNLKRIIDTYLPNEKTKDKVKI